QWRKTEGANGVHLEGVASDNRSSSNGNKTTNLTSKEAKMGKVMRHTLGASCLSLSKHLAHNLGNLLLLGKIGVFHNRRNASSRLLLLISKHLILCIYLVFRILA